MARTGRRKGSPDTREAILAAARTAFAERGFDGASIRIIATSAGVDPALVHHYFGTKDKLFRTCVGAPIDPRELVGQITNGGLDGIGDRIVRTFLSVWDHPVSGPALAALVRSGVQHDWSARMLREFITTQILRRATSELGVEPAQAQVRAGLVATQVGGLIMARYLLKIEPLASASADEVVAALGPNVQRFVTGPLPTSGATLSAVAVNDAL